MTDYTHTINSEGKSWATDMRESGGGYVVTIVYGPPWEQKLLLTGGSTQEQCALSGAITNLLNGVHYRPCH